VKILIAAAGSGGHIIPAQAVAEKLEGHTSICFAGHNLSQNPYFDRTRWDYVDVPAAPLSLRGGARFVCSTLFGMKKAWCLLNGCSLVIGFGSYHTVPVLAAALLRRIPFVLYEANARPGKVIRLFSPYARWTGCYFKEAAAFLKGNVEIISHPLRSSLSSFPSQEEARRYFGLDPSKKAILVVGGSQGAALFSSLLPQAIRKIGTKPSVIHLAGHTADIAFLKRQYEGIDVCVKPFEENMAFAYSAADAIVSRAGASAICEIEQAQKRALFIPFAKASDNHQKQNAQAALLNREHLLIEEHEATPKIVAGALSTLLFSQTEERKPYEPNRALSSLVLESLT